jgi:hypothetical protein
MDDKKIGWNIVERAKLKNQTQAEHLFKRYCHSQTWFWGYAEWRKTALDILGCGIFQGNKLKGHAGHKRTYPVDLGDLIMDLVKKHFDYDIDLPYGRFFHRLEGPLSDEVVNEFDYYFNFVATIARLGSVRKDVVEKIWDDWREKVRSAAIQGKISHQWRKEMMHQIHFGGSYRPKKIAYEFADIFVRYVPQAPAGRTANWVNATLKCLGRPSASKSSLTTYVKQQQNSLQTTPVEITE